MTLATLISSAFSNGIMGSFTANGGGSHTETTPSTTTTQTASTIPDATTFANRLNVDVETKVYKNPASTVDALVVRKNMVTGCFELLVIQRGRNPYQGFWALPGGFTEYGEDPEVAVLRELEEETLLQVDPAAKQVKLIAVRGKGDRDPRQHIITIAYSVKVDKESLPLCAGSDDAKGAQWIKLDDIGTESFPLAFDHVHIVDTFRAWFNKEGIAAGWFVEDVNPRQPGSSKQ
ncbi:hypothetical protein HDU76_012800 [Blyttiomyces sp. JEL0837]|nr:hypothetical protein HDU76_012800 [Blyttiomyces sp. JEL0837]